jgi:hypothetical protein
MSFGERMDIQKGVMLIVFCYFVAWDLSFDDACEECHDWYDLMY